MTVLEKDNEFQAADSANASSTDTELTLTLWNIAELEEDDEFWAVLSPNTPSMWSSR